MKLENANDINIEKTKSNIDNSEDGRKKETKTTKLFRFFCSIMESFIVSFVGKSFLFESSNWNSDSKEDGKHSLFLFLHRFSAIHL